MLPSRPSPSDWTPLDKWSTIRKVSTAKPTCESTCEDICEIDGVLWKNREGWVDVRPSVDLLENGRLWIEWKGSGVAYDLDQEEAEWLSQTLIDILKKSAKPSEG
jgi:hypothetical protein